MAMYVTLYKFTAQGIRDLHGSPDRVNQAIQAAERAGIKVLSVLYTQGQYDLVTVSEAPSDEAAMGFTLATVMRGNVTSESMKAYTADEFRAILGKIPA